MDTTTSVFGKPEVSRRSFVKLTVGAIVMLPTVSDALFLPAETAFAEEGGKAADVVEGSAVHIVRTNEFGMVVRDVSLPDDGANLVAGAHVKITSRFNGVVLEDDTDNEGGVTFDITKLSEDARKKEIPAEYAFNATLEVTAPGYRSFRADLYRIEGGTALSFPTQPVVDGIPYPVSVSFDEWDVLYTEGDSSTFVSSTGNDVAHDFTLKLADCPAGAAIAAGIFADGVQVASAGAKAAADGTASITFTDTFLLSNSEAALPAGDDHSYTVRYTIGDTTFEAPIKPTVLAAPPEAQDLQLKKDLELTPFNDTTMFIGVSIPKGFPMIGGEKFQLWKPNFWADFAYDPFGFIRVKFTTPEWGYIKDNGEPDKNAWKFHPRDTPKKQFEDMLKGMEKKVDKVIDASNKPGAVKQASFTQKLSFTLQAEFTAAATWEFGDKESRGRAQLALRFGANYSLMEQFFLGAVPIVIRFGIGLNGVAAGEVGYVSPSVWKFTQYRWDWSSTGFDFQVSVAPMLSVGVGIGGVCSLALKGAAYITFALHEGPKPKGYENLPVHLRLAYGASLSVVLELLFFTQSFILCKKDEPNWHDNWKGLLGDGLSEIPPALQQGVTFGQSLNNAKIITEKSLEAVAEFKTAGVEGMKPQETKLTHYVLNRKEADGETTVAELFLSDDATATLQESPLVSFVAQDEGSSSARHALNGESRGGHEGGLAAGSAAGLSAQDDDQAQYVLRAANNQVSRWETDLPAATAIGEHNYQAVPAGKPNVLRLGMEQGIATNADVRIADNVLSSSHLKLFSAGDGDYIVRIGAVMVAGNVRTRLIAERVGGNERCVIDFKTTENRDECFDYDFDVSTTHVNGEEIVNLLVISGTRPKGDATPLASAVGQTFFSFLTCKNWGGKATFTGVTLDATFFDAIGDRGQTYPYRSYSCPQVRQIKGSRNGVEYGHAVVTFLERASRFEEDLMLDDRDLTRTGVGLLFFNDVDQGVNVSGMDTIRPIVTQQIQDSSIMEMTLSERVGGWHVLMLKGAAQTYYAFVETEPCAAVIGGRAIPLVLNASLADLGGREIPRLVPVPAQEHFLACVDGKLKKVVVDASGTAPTLSFEDIEGADINLNDFGVATSGDVLYWPASRENGGYDIDENGEATLRTGEGGEIHQIVGARLRNGKLSRGMVLSEVSHPMNRIRSFDQSGNYLSFISSDALDDEAGKGELWYTAVPWVRCATLIGAVPHANVLAAGDKLSFYLMLRNDGNCFLSGVELAVAEAGKDPFGTIRLDFSEENTLQSEWNPPGDDGSLQGVEDDWALAPGMSARYHTGYVTIPESWEGDKKIEVFVTAVYAVGSGTLSTQAEDESIEYIPNQRAQGSLFLDAGQTAVGYEGTYSPSDVTATKGDPGSGDNANGGASNSSGNPTTSTKASSQSASTKSSVPRTGDAASLAALAAAGAAAGLTARHALHKRHEAEGAGQQCSSETQATAEGDEF